MLKAHMLNFLKILYTNDPNRLAEIFLSCLVFLNISIQFKFNVKVKLKHLIDTFQCPK